MWYIKSAIYSASGSKASSDGFVHTWDETNGVRLPRLTCILKNIDSKDEIESIFPDDLGKHILYGCRANEIWLPQSIDIRGRGITEYVMGKVELGDEVIYIVDEMAEVVGEVKNHLCVKKYFAQVYYHIDDVFSIGNMLVSGAHLIASVFSVVTVDVTRYDYITILDAEGDGVCLHINDKKAFLNYYTKYLLWVKRRV